MSYENAISRDPRAALGRALMGNAPAPRDLPSGLAHLGSTLAGAYMQKKAADSANEAVTAENKALADALRGRGADESLIALSQMPGARPAVLASILNGEDKPTYASPIEAAGPDGTPVFVRPGSDGSMQPVDGYSPLPKQVDTFETVNDPYGKGGVGQRNTRTGQIVGYQAPPKAKEPKRLWAYNTELDKPEYVDETQLARAPEGLYLDERPETGAFPGNGLDASVFNTLIAYNQKKAGGAPTTQQEDMAYSLAYAKASRPTTYTTEQGTFQQPGMDLAGFAQPSASFAQPVEPTGSVPDEPQPVVQQAVDGQPVPQAPGAANASIPSTATQIGGSKTDTANNKILLEKQEVLGQLKDRLSNYRKKIEETGYEVLPGSSSADLKATYTDLLLSVKEYMNLGVLNGPDLGLVQSMLSDPTDLSSAAVGGASEMITGKSPLIAQIDALSDILDRSLETTRKTYGPQQPSETQPKRRRYNPETDSLE